MKIDLAKPGAAPTEFDLSIAPNELNLESGFAVAKSDVRFRGTIFIRDKWTLIDGKILVEVDIACGRCLEAVEKAFNITFKDAFVKAGNYTEELEAELGINNLEVSIFEGNEIDLTEVAEEKILLCLPNRVYCRANCRGLCQKCGANLNRINCKCEEMKFDQRWSTLKSLKSRE